VANQAELDLGTALEAYRTRRARRHDPRALATELAEVLLPLTLDAVVSWCERQLDSHENEQKTSLGDSLAEAVRALLVNAILPRVLGFAAEKVIESVAPRPCRIGP
jgi:hypothetical protein